MNKDLFILIIGLIVVFGIGVIVGNNTAERGAMGGMVHNVQETFDAGIAVQGTEFINDERDLTVVDITASGESNLDTLVQGGDVTILTGVSTTTLTAAQVCDTSLFTYGSTTAAAGSTTLPSAATIIADCLTTDGDSKTIKFRNTASLATQTTVIVVASTTAEELLMPEGADVIIDGGNSAIIEFLRNSATTLIITVTELVVGD